jgi:hypothetical protein
MADVSPNAPPSSAAPVTTGGRRRRGLSTSWMAHVKATMRAHKGLKLKQVLKLAKKTYKKAKKGGAVLTPLPLSGGRKHRGATRRARGGNEEGDDMEV